MALPACSMFSRTIDDEWFFDCAYQTDEGAVYIGQRDFEEMAGVAGWVPPEKYAKLLNAYKELADEHNSITSNLDSLDTVLTSLDSIIPTIKGIREATTARTKAVARQSNGTSKSSAKS